MNIQIKAGRALEMLLPVFEHSLKLFFFPLKVGILQINIMAENQPNEFICCAIISKRGIVDRFSTCRGGYRINFTNLVDFIHISYLAYHIPIHFVSYERRIGVIIYLRRTSFVCMMVPHLVYSNEETSISLPGSCTLYRLPAWHLDLHKKVSLFRAHKLCSYINAIK